MQVVSKWLRKIRQTYKDIRKMKKIRELFYYPKEQTLSKIAFLLIALFFLSPTYRLLNSLTLQFHDASFYFVNDSMLARDQLHFLQQLGYFGLFLGLFTISRSILYAKDQHTSFKIYIKDHSVPILLLLFLLFTFISALFSDDLSISFYGNPYRKEGFLTYLAYSGLFISAYQLKNTKYLKCLVLTLIFSGVVLSILTIINLSSLNDLFTLSKQTSIFHNANHYAYYLNILILTSTLLIYFWRNASLTKRILSYLFLALFTFTLVDNGSFGSYLGAVAGILFLDVFLFFYHKNERRLLSMITLVFVVASFVSSIDEGFILSEVSKIAENTGDIIENNEDAPNAGSGRWSLWTNALEFAFEKPIVGYGVDNLGDRYLEAGNTSDRPHNEYLQIAASIGFPALILYLSALGTHFFQILKKKGKIGPLEILLYATVFAYLAGAFFGNSMYYTTPYYIVFFAVSVSFQQKTYSPIKKSTE